MDSQKQLFALRLFNFIKNKSFKKIQYNWTQKFPLTNYLSLLFLLLTGIHTVYFKEIITSYILTYKCRIELTTPTLQNKNFSQEMFNIKTLNTLTTS